MRQRYECSECKQDNLWSECEIDMRLCNRCADRMYTRDQERREFEYYHPGDE